MFKKTICCSLFLLILTAVVIAVPATTSANSGYGGGNKQITVCKKTGSRFLPYVKVTVPKKVGEQFLHEGGVLPNNKGECPKGISIRDYISELFHNIFDRFGHDNNDKLAKNH